MAEIRRATFDDVPRMVELGQSMHDESPRFRDRAYNPERAKFSMEAVIGMNRGLAMVAEADGQIVGGIVALAVEHYACDFLQACDLALFIHPEHRGGTLAARLVRAYVKWAVSIGAEPNIQLNTGVDPERTAQLLGALGAKQTGTNWTWGASCA